MKSSRSGVTAEFSAKASIRKDGRINLYGPGWLVQVNRESNPTLFAHLEATIAAAQRQTLGRIKATVEKRRVP
jgi:hypothetical protein